MRYACGARVVRVFRTRQSDLTDSLSLHFHFNRRLYTFGTIVRVR
jgi:hypothetical protein